MQPLSFLSPKTEVKESAIHGRGLFAKEQIGVGEIVAVKGGSIVTRDRLRQLQPRVGSAEIQIVTTSSSVRSQKRNAKAR